MAKKKKTFTLTNSKIQEIIERIAGPDAVKIVKYLDNKKNISEFVVAEKTKLDMQTTRHILYRLNNFNIATYIRKKDRQKGWYISYWTFNRRRVKDLILKLQKEHLEKLHDQLRKEEANKNNFFICSRACSRLDFDQAIEFEFKCPECGSLMHQQENERTIENIKEKIKAIVVSS
ncbi:hypothetical protein J4453_01580 [Candidatus Woesearchaeota archaeon]|nr:hypothetical protein [Candidatus Woesearchaeota archaeon]